MNPATGAGDLPVSVLIFLGLTILLSIIIPVTFYLYLKHSGGVKHRPILIGMAAFFVSALILERILHYLVLNLDHPLSRFLTTGGVGNALCYALYGGFAAGIFEETARYIAFKTILKNENGRRIPLLYGIGHGGIEAFLLCTIPMLANFMTAVSLRNRGMDAFLAGYPQDQAELLRSTFSAFYTTPAAMYLLSGLERIFAFAIHVSLSVLVYIAVKNTRKKLFFPYAIMLHALVDYIPGLYQAGLIDSLWLVEAYTGMWAVFLSLMAFAMYRKNLMNLPEI